jgi:hypothetical protein
MGRHSLWRLSLTGQRPRKATKTHVSRHGHAPGPLPDAGSRETGVAVQDDLSAKNALESRDERDPAGERR